MNKYVEFLKIMSRFRTPAQTGSREFLSRYLNITDRQLRKMIEEARNSGIPFISSSNSKGYFLSYDREHIQQLVAEYKHRANKNLATARALENAMWKAEVKENVGELTEGEKEVIDGLVGVLKDIMGVR